MAIKTVIFWGATPDKETELRLELNRQVTNGTTDGNFEIEHGRVVRSWTTVEAAQSWIDFLNSLDPQPISAEVVQD